MKFSNFQTILDEEFCLDKSLKLEKHCANSFNLIDSFNWQQKNIANNISLFFGW